MRHSRSALCMLMLIFWAGALQHSSFACEFEAYPLGPALTMTPQPSTKFTEIYIQLKNDIITVSYTLDTPESDTYMLEVVGAPLTVPRGCERPWQSYNVLKFLLNGSVQGHQHESIAKDWQGQDITARLSEAGLSPNMLNKAVLLAPQSPPQKHAWERLVKEGLLIQDRYSRSIPKEYEPTWIAHNRLWTIIKLQKNGKNQSIGIQYPVKMGFAYQSGESFTHSAAPWYMRDSGMNAERAAKAIGLPTDATAYVEWFSVPLSSLLWPMGQETLPYLRFAAVREPNEGKYPIYMAVRIGDQQAEGVGHVELTVENYRPSMGGLFSSVYFLVDKNGDRP